MDRREFFKLIGAGAIITAVPFSITAAALGRQPIINHGLDPQLFDPTQTYGNFVIITGDEFDQITIDEAVEVLTEQASEVIPRGFDIDIILHEPGFAGTADPFEEHAAVAWKYPARYQDNQWTLGQVRL